MTYLLIALGILASIVLLVFMGCIAFMLLFLKALYDDELK